MNDRSRVHRKNGAGTMRIVLALLLVVCAGSWGWLIAGHRRGEKQYAAQKEKAAVCYEKKIYDEALELCQTCKKTHPDDADVLYLTAKIYYATERYDSAIASCTQFLEQKPENEKGLLLKARSYAAQKQYAKAAELLQSAPDTEAVKKYRTELDGMFKLTFSDYSMVGGWFEAADGRQLAMVVSNKKVSLVTAAGKTYLSGNFSELGQPSDDGKLFPAVLEEEHCFVDKDGKRRKVPDVEYGFLGPLWEDLAPAEREGTWGYVTEDFEETHFDYDRTWPFVDGTALVWKGGSYEVVDHSFRTVKKCEFTKVLENEYGMVCNCGVMIGMVNDHWRLYDTAGKRIGSWEAEQIAFPEEKDGLVAFCRDGKWGYATQKGTVVLEPRYEEARSFSNGYGAVKEGGLWGYVNRMGETVIPYQFINAYPISRNGTAWTANNAGFSLLSLYKFQE